MITGLILFMINIAVLALVCLWGYRKARKGGLYEAIHIAAAHITEHEAHR